MSDLKPVGVELVADGSQTFERALGRANAAVATLEKTAASAATKGVNLLGQVVIGAARRIGELFVDGLVRAGREVLQFGQRLLRAAVDGTQLESTLDKLWRSAVQVTRTSLSPFFEQFDSLIQRVAPKVLGFAQVLGEEFSGLANQALAWGENIVSQLAQGMWNALVYVVQVLTDIGSTITSWLAPGSPPKLLPDLDDWGTEAMNVWLKGWTKGDFSIFNTVATQLESLIRSTAQPGGKDTGLIGRILGAREGIAQAVDELRRIGQVSQETLSRIIQQVGTAGQGVQAFLESFIALEAANQAAADAQARLNAVTAEYDALLKPVTDQLEKIDEATRQFDEDQQKRMLALVLADPNATASEKRRAQLEIERINAERAKRALLSQKAEAVDAAQTELDAALAAQEAAKAQYDAQAALLALQTEQNNLLKEQLTLLDKLSAAAGGGAKGGGAKGGGSVFGIDLDGARQKIQELKDKLFDMFTGLWEAWKGPIERAWNFVKDQFNLAWPTIKQNLTDGLIALENLWGRHGPTVVGILGGAFAIIATSISTSMTFLSGVLTTGLQLLEGDWDGAKTTILRTAESIKDQVNRLFLELFGITLGDMQRWMDDVGVKWDAFALTWSIDLSTWLNDTSLALSNWLNTTANTLLGQVLTQFVAVGANIVISIANGITSSLGILSGAIQSAVNSALAAAGLPGVFAFTGPGSSGGTVHPPSTTPNVTTNSSGNSYSNNFNLNVATQQSTGSVQSDFALMQVWAR